MSAVADDAVVDGDYPPEMFATYVALADEIAEHFDLEAIRATQDLDGALLGRSKRERAYRRWSLSERLFLNPINDLGPVSIAARDTLVLPGLTEVNPPTRPGLILMILHAPILIAYAALWADTMDSSRQIGDLINVANVAWPGMSAGESGCSSMSKLNESSA